MNLRRIRYFLELDRSTSLTMAARRLGISQPALSKALIRLEDEVGGALVRRDVRGIELTELGRAMRDRFRALDEAARTAWDAAARLTHAPRRRFVLAVQAGVGAARMLDLLEAFHRRQPARELSIRRQTPDEMAVALRAGAIDGALLSDTLDPDPTLCPERLLLEPYEAIEPVAAANEVAPTRLEGLAQDAGAETSTDPRPVSVRSARDDWTQALVSAGLGGAVLPRDNIVMLDLHRSASNERCRARQLTLVVRCSRTEEIDVREFVELARRHVA